MTDLEIGELWLKETDIDPNMTISAFCAKHGLQHRRNSWIFRPAVKNMKDSNTLMDLVALSCSKSNCRKNVVKARERTPRGKKHDQVSS